jgi:hypothetical protein
MSLPSKPTIDLQPMGPQIVKQRTPDKPQATRTPSGKSIFLATPTLYGYKFNWVHSVLTLVDRCAKRNVSLSFGFMEGGSLIPHTRNDLARQFLAGKWTHMLMTDDDVGFEADDVFKMLDTGHDFLCGAVPLRRINRQAIDQYMADGTFDPDKHLTQFNINTRDTNYELHVNADGTCDVTFAGTAFLLVSRKAFEMILDKFPPLVYSNGEEKTNDFFGLMYTRREDGSLEALGEDVSFCERFKQSGGQIKLWPNMNLSHCGPYTFSGNFGKSVGVK